MSHAAGVAVAAFQSPFLGAFPQNQTIFTSPASASGHTPAAAIFVFVGADSLDTIDTTESAARMSIGFTDGTTHRCVAFQGDHGVAAASADTGYRIDTATVIQQSGTGGEGLNSEASFVSFGTDSVTIQWSASPGGRYGYVVFFYGEDVQANVTSFASSSATTSTTAPGFQPDIIFAAAVGQAFTADGEGGEGMLSLGMAARAPSITQCCHAIVAEDRQSATSSGCEARSDSIVAVLTSTAATVAESVRLSVSAFGASGFSVDRSASVSTEAMYLSVKGFTGFCAAADTADVQSLGAHSITGVGFKPQTLFVLGARTEVDTVQQVNGGLSLGVVSQVGSTTTAVGAGVHFRDNQATSEGTTSISSTDIVVLQSSTTAYDWKADFDSFDQDGWTYTVNDAAGAPRCIPFMALGPAPVVSSDTEQISDGFVLFVEYIVPTADTEQISDGFVMVASGGVAAYIRTTETENISDAFVLVIKEIISETEQISDEVLFFARQAIPTETVQISDGAVLALKTAIFQVTDTERISDQVLLYLGRVLVSNDTVQISDQANTGAGLIALKRTWRGAVLE